MLFSSYSFIFIFLPVLIILYYVCPDKLKNYLLLAASLGFYAWGGPRYLLVMLASIVINYVCGLLVGIAGDRDKLSKLAVVLAAVLNLALLGYYKYTDFLIENVNAVLRTDISLRHIILPIGISFYTFQGLSYVLDVRRGKGQVLKNPLKLALYISLFPQLIAGPIVRYETIADQIDNRQTTIDDLNQGMFRFVIGLAKKVLLANQLGELARTGFSLPFDELSLVTAWFGAAAYTLQIYFDFSGYSDMAIGLGRVFGFRFSENFNFPFISKDVTEYWTRWHISMTTWFRDYVYIPLGGNRKGPARQYLNIIIVWFLSGLWHGAAWSYVLWGLFFALVLVCERLFLLKYIRKLPDILRKVYVGIVVIMSFVIFNGSSLKHIGIYMVTMFNLSKNSSLFGMQFMHIMQEYGLLMLIGLFFSTPYIYRIAAWIRDRFGNRTYKCAKVCAFVAMFGLSVMRLIVSSYNPFIYFRF